MYMYSHSYRKGMYVPPTYLYGGRGEQAPGKELQEDDYGSMDDTGLPISLTDNRREHTNHFKYT